MSTSISIADYQQPAPIERHELAARCQRGWRAADVMTRASTSELEPRGQGVKLHMMSNALNSAVNGVVALLETGASDQAIRESRDLATLEDFELAHFELFAVV